MATKWFNSLDTNSSSVSYSCPINDCMTLYFRVVQGQKLGLQFWHIEDLLYMTSTKINKIMRLATLHGWLGLKIVNLTLLATSKSEQTRTFPKMWFMAGSNRLSNSIKSMALKCFENLFFWSWHFLVLYSILLL